MRNFLSSLLMATLGFGTIATAQSSVVVVELYTSQGCSSCPAADEILKEVAVDESVIALGLHVDYWDYLGWKDELARPEFTERQARFNTKMKSRYRLVTPQMIFQGYDYVAGAKRAKALDYIQAIKNKPEGAQIEIKRDGNSMMISLAPNATGSPQADIHVVRFTPLVSVDIRGGENRGRKMDYNNVVTSWDTIGQWDGATPTQLSHSLTGEEQLAVILQTKGLGPILAARRLDN